jgi:hypothetical protein
MISLPDTPAAHRFLDLLWAEVQRQHNSDGASLTQAEAQAETAQQQSAR